MKARGKIWRTEHATEKKKHWDIYFNNLKFLSISFWLSRWMINGWRFLLLKWKTLSVVFNANALPVKGKPYTHTSNNAYKNRNVHLFFFCLWQILCSHLHKSFFAWSNLKYQKIFAFLLYGFFLFCCCFFVVAKLTFIYVCHKYAYSLFICLSTHQSHCLMLKCVFSVYMIYQKLFYHLYIIFFLSLLLYLCVFCMQSPWKLRNSIIFQTYDPHIEWMEIMALLNTVHTYIEIRFHSMSPFWYGISE